MLIEFQVYLRVINFLCQRGWQIICSSPPGGTDSRFRKCVLPRKEQGIVKGPRDEVDVTAIKNNILLLIECKSLLSDSFYSHREAESDYVKLKRIISSFEPNVLARLINVGYGTNISDDIVISSALAVSHINIQIPIDMTVMEFSKVHSKIWPVLPLDYSYFY